MVADADEFVCCVRSCESGSLSDVSDGSSGILMIMIPLHLLMGFAWRSRLVLIVASIRSHFRSLILYLAQYSGLLSDKSCK